MKLKSHVLTVFGGVCALTLGLAACAPGGQASLNGPIPLTPTSRYSLQAEPGLDRIALAVHETGLSSNQQAALSALVGRYAQSGEGDIVIEAPSGGDPTAAAVAWSVRDNLISTGVPAERIRVVSYQAPNPKAPILSGFEVLRAVVPQCGRAWGSLTRTGDNQPASNFGCAVTANLAAQVARPADLNGPRPLSAASHARRAIIYDKYIAGTETSSAAESRLTSTSVQSAVE